MVVSPAISKSVSGLVRNIMVSCRICIFISLFSLYGRLQAQSLITVSVVDPKRQSVNGAFAELLRCADSSLIIRTVCNSNGVAEFRDVKIGIYLIKIQAINAQAVYSPPFTVIAGMRELTLPVIIMAEQTATELSGVTVSATRPFVQLLSDRTVINTGSNIGNAGISVLEVLEKSPGVIVSNEGKLSLIGKSSVLVLLDGKPSYLSVSELANLLRSMPSASVDQIEIINNPPPAYDAEGNGGIINIKTKKGRAKGFNASVTLVVTACLYQNRTGTFYIPVRTPENISFNFRKNKLNLYVNYNALRAWRKTNLLYNRIKLDTPEIVTGYNQTQSDYNRNVTTHSLKLGLEYQPDFSNSYGIVISGTSNRRLLNHTAYTSIRDQNLELISVMDTKTTNSIYLKDMSFSFYYSHKFDTAGKELTFDADYIFNRNSSFTQLTTGFYSPLFQPTGTSLVLYGMMPSKIDILSVRSDCLLPLNKSVSIDFGAKVSFVKNDNLVKFSRLNGTNWVNDNRSNHFLYQENINAFYLSAVKKTGKWNFRAGFRLENTIAEGYQAINDSAFKRNLINFFPSVNISYSGQKGSRVIIAAGRRISRPNFDDLNPFMNFIDSISFRVGNPLLLPQLTINTEVSYLYKDRIRLSLNYTKTANAISAMVFTEDNVVYTQPRNLSSFRNAGIAVYTNFAITARWGSVVSLNIFNNRYKGLYTNSPVLIDITQYLINLTETYSFKSGFIAELSGVYRSKGADQFVITGPQWWLNAGIQKRSLNGKGVFRFNLRDIFWSQKITGYENYGLLKTVSDNITDSRQVIFSFTYRIGKNSQPDIPRRRGAVLQDEQSRTGQ